MCSHICTLLLKRVSPAKNVVVYNEMATLSGFTPSLKVSFRAIYVAKNAAHFFANGQCGNLREPEIVALAPPLQDINKCENAAVEMNVEIN